MQIKKPQLLTTEDFLYHLGSFWAAWASTELLTSFTIGKLLNLSPEQTHLITASMEFGRKATLLRSLLKRSSHPKKEALLEALGKIQNNKRNILAHSYALSSSTTVTFIERKLARDYKAEEHTFTLPGFEAHVDAFVNAGTDFEEALGSPNAEVQAFAKAALSA